MALLLPNGQIHSVQYLKLPHFPFQAHKNQSYYKLLSTPIYRRLLWNTDKMRGRMRLQFRCAFGQTIPMQLQMCLMRAKVPAIIVFGDSTVDAGNNNQISTILKSNFEPYGRDFTGGKPNGRFSNGRIPSDFISEAFGLKSTVPAYLDPTYNISDFSIGVSFASAGTGYDNETSDVLSVIPLWKELEYYKDYQNKLSAHLGKKKANERLSEALYLMSLGTNDFLENYYSMFSRRSEFSIS